MLLFFDVQVLWKFGEQFPFIECGREFSAQCNRYINSNRRHALVSVTFFQKGIPQFGMLALGT